MSYFSFQFLWALFSCESVFGENPICVCFKKMFMFVLLLGCLEMEWFSSDSGVKGEAENQDSTNLNWETNVSCLEKAILTEIIFFKWLEITSFKTASCTVLITELFSMYTFLQHVILIFSYGRVTLHVSIVFCLFPIFLPSRHSLQCCFAQT